MKIMDLVAINFSSFKSTCSIYLEMCNEFNISGYIF